MEEEKPQEQPKEQTKEPEKQVPDNANKGCPGVQSSDAGKQDGCKGCPMQKNCKSGKLKKVLNETQNKVTEKLSKVKHKIMILSGKGGVGKSTVSAQLALALALEGKEIGILDIDICGPSIPRMLGLEGHSVHQSNEGWSPVYAEDNLGVMSIGFMLDNQDQAIVWRGPRKNGLIKQFLTDVAWGELDYLIIDSPPGTSDEHISIVQYIKQNEYDGVVIVTTPQEVAIADVRKQLNFCKKTNVRVIGVIENMSGFVCPHCDCESQIFPPVKGGAEKMCKDFGIKFLGKIPLDPNLLLSCEKGMSILEEKPKSQTAKCYRSIIEQIKADVEGIKAEIDQKNE